MFSAGEGNGFDFADVGGERRLNAVLAVDEMYPDGMAGQTRVSVPQLSEGLCGASRPGHFEGVEGVLFVKIPTW